MISKNGLKQWFHKWSPKWFSKKVSKNGLRKYSKK